MLTDAQLAAQVAQRIDQLAKLSEEPGRLTRAYGSVAMRQANDLVAGWLREAGMSAREDAIGNLIGAYAGSPSATRSFLLGSHLDTVRDAGRFDGALGVLVAIACVEKLHQAGRRLPFAVEVIAFADEEGVRFQTACLGSRVAAGVFHESDLQRRDAHGLTLAETIRNFGGNPALLGQARRDPKQLLGYAEVHIEQGPVLQDKNLPVGGVSAICGQTRVQVRFVGRAAHAGTTPMNLRRDALVPAAEFIVMAQSVTEDDPDLVATVGQVEVSPGASNVVPGQVVLSLDVRHPLDDRRDAACEHLHAVAHDIAKKGAVRVEWEVVQETDAVACSPELSATLAHAARRHVRDFVQLPSGAGHDAAVMAALTPVAMLFVRCKDGTSHHPDESVRVEDVTVAISVMSDFLELVAKQHG
jgi:allantoate deiminase